MSAKPTTLPGVVCLHASGGSGAQWRVLADRLRYGFRVLTPDLHGHGEGPAWSGARRDVAAADTARIAAIAASAVGECTWSDIRMVARSRCMLRAIVRTWSRA
jgi:pimeloyl-ACP methyl ester carboxylesterase